MQLKEILEENSVKSISQKTNISEINIDALVAADFDKLKKVKTLGFISILEREYKADLSAFKEQALEYYADNIEKESVTLGLPLDEEKKGSSKWFKLLILILIAYTVWYFFTQFDKTMLTDLLPLSEDKISAMLSDNVKKELSIENMNIERTETNIEVGSETSVVLDNESNVQE